MSRNRYTIGVDFGTESACAVLVDVADGRELATAVHQYATGVIDEQLPHLDEDVVLEHDWALQDPANYIASFQVAVPRALAESGVDPGDVIGIGIDFTVCTMLPTTADGTPLRFLDAYRRELHAYQNLVLDRTGAEPLLVARVRDPDSGRVLELLTTEPALPMYSGNQLPTIGGKRGAEYRVYAVCAWNPSASRTL